MLAVADAVEARHAVIVAADRLAVDDAGARAQLASASTIREHRVVAGRLHSAGEKLARIWPGAREERSSSEKGKTERAPKAHPIALGVVAALALSAM